MTSDLTVCHGPTGPQQHARQFFGLGLWGSSNTSSNARPTVQLNPFWHEDISIISHKNLPRNHEHISLNTSIYFRQFTEIPSPSMPQAITGTFLAVGHRSLTPCSSATRWRRADGVPILDGADRRRLQVWLFNGESLGWWMIKRW